MLTADNHNSVNGIREFARARGAVTRYVGLSPVDLRADGEDVAAALGRGGAAGHGRGLFAYPAQSNFSGVRHPLAWVDHAQAAGYDVLLDAAAFAPTSPGPRRGQARVRDGELLQDVRLPDRNRLPAGSAGRAHPAAPTVVLGRHDRRRERQGGWHRLADDETAFEDGTLNFLAIPDVTTGLAWISDIGIDLIRRRVDCLTGWLLDGLAALKHGNGTPMVRVYGPGPGQSRGVTVTFNFLDPHGAVVDERAVARDASAAGISVRTGCFCNPGAGERAFGLSQQDVGGAWWRGARGATCGRSTTT